MWRPRGRLAPQLFQSCSSALIFSTPPHLHTAHHLGSCYAEHYSLFQAIHCLLTIDRVSLVAQAGGDTSTSIQWGAATCIPVSATTRGSCPSALLLAAAPLKESEAPVCCIHGFRFVLILFGRVCLNSRRLSTGCCLVAWCITALAVFSSTLKLKV